MRTLAFIAVTMLLVAIGGCLHTQSLPPDPAAGSDRSPGADTAVPAPAPAPAQRQPLPLLNR